MHAFLTMHAHELFVGNLGMTAFAAHRVEPTSVSAVRTDMAIEALGPAVGGTIEECEINFVAIVARVLLLGVDGL